jgi:uncharacterized protein YbaR (Trm112 family)
MFLELTEILRCPQPHDESYVICAPVTSDGRDVVRGGLLCPVCRRQYAILDRVAWLGAPGEPVTGADVAAADSQLNLEAALTFLDLQGAGGVVVTMGRAGRLAPELARALPGIAIAAINPPDGIVPDGSFSVIRSPAGLPVRRHMVRAAIVGADVARSAWLEGAAASVLTGLRLVVEDERAEPRGFVELARGAGVFVGEKRSA